MDDASKELQQLQSEIATVEARMSEQVVGFQNTLVALRQKDTDLRNRLKTAMEEKGVKKFENEYVSISYTAPTTRTTFDSTKFKKEMPTVYEQYTKTSEVKGSVRIKVKETN